MRYTRAQIVDGTGFQPDAQFEQVEDYNGWTNRETWAVALHINNDQGWQESVFDVVRGVIENQLVNHHTTEVPAYKVGEAIADSIEELFDWSQYFNGESVTRGFGDHYTIPKGLLDAREDIGSLYRVNWDEIGAAFLTDVQEAGE